MSTTQDNKLLNLVTPLGKDFLLLESFAANEGISELFRYELEMLHDEGDAGHDPMIVDVSRILGQSVTIHVEQKEGTKRFFNGIVSEFSQGSRNGRFTNYQAVVVPEIWLLTQIKQSRIFQHLSIPDILKKVFEGHETSFELQGTFEQREFCVQYRESDWDFASRLMEEEGIYYYFAHENGKHKLIVANTPQSHADCPGKSEIEFALEVEADDLTTAISSWRVEHRLRTGKTTLWDYHFQLPTNKLDAEQPSRFDIGNNQELESYDFPAGYANGFDGIDKSGGEQSSNLQKVFQVKQRIAEIRQQEIDAEYQTTKATSDCCSLTAGHRFKLKSHPNRANNIRHVLTKVEHQAVQSPSYISGEDVSEAYSNSFVCMAYGGNNAPFRPPQKTPKPTVQGSQTATVVGPAGEEIFTDKYGRVKVQFSWDRSLPFSPESSCWIRVAHDLAGNKWGQMHIPRIGQEVIVDFIEGNPDQPIITGAVYNPETMPHYELPKFKTLTYIKTRTSPDDGKGYNELRFEDKAGKEQVFVRSQKRMDVRVRANLYETCGGDRQEVIGVRADEKPGGNLATTIGGSHDLHIKADEFIGIDGKLNIAVKGEVVEDFQTSLSTMVKMKAELNAMEITLEAKTKITLKVGGNCIMIDPSGITIAGTMVKINSGGFASGAGSPSIDDPLDAEIADTGEPGYLEKPRTGGGSKKRNRRKLNAQHYIAPPRPGEDPRITAMRNTLQNSEQGRHSLEVYDRYNVQPTFTPGQGSSYDGTNNTMNLDPTENPTTSALTFAHEMNHAEAGNEQRTANAATQNRADYVNTMLDEETEGTVRSIEARNELAQNGTDVSNAHFPLENEYQTAYDNAVTAAKNANPNATQAELAEAGKKAGRDRVRQGFDNGEVVPSTSTGQTYPQYYGGSWDGQQPPP
ncbi:MAG: type VI secretion system tip protein VgrG [Pyrinomonadaceae bacterium]|nr:type VI secretion system tip protein VgrG [Pyrinomonadaceae bacterium]